MKKLVLFASAIIALSFASCANKGNAEGTEQNDTTATTVETPAVTEPAANDTTATTTENEAVKEDAVKVDAEKAAPEVKE